MIAININFLSDRRQEVQRAQALDTRIFQVSLGIFGVVLTVVVGAFAFWRYQIYQLNEIKNDQQEQTRIITAAAEDEALYLLYTTRLDLISSVFEVRSSKRRAMEFLAQLVLPNVTFDRVTYDSATRTLTYRVAAVNVFAVEQYLERLRSPGIRDQIADVQVGTIRRDEFGGYTLENIVVLNSDAESDGGVPLPTIAPVPTAQPTPRATATPAPAAPGSFDSLPSVETLGPGETSEPEEEAL